MLAQEQEQVTGDVAAGEQGVVVAAGAGSAAHAGLQQLEAGGNAVDAALAAALCAGVVAPASCGLAGYGAHLTVALADGTVACIDANCAAPAAAHATMYEPGATGGAQQQGNYYGWSAVAVPGTPAGLQLALERYGSMPLADIAAPAIGYARDGFPVSEAVARSVAGAAAQLSRDAGAAALYLPHGSAVRAGQQLRNPQLADALESLVSQRSLAAFYHNELGQRVAAAAQQHGGILTATDLASYRALKATPSAIVAGDLAVHTAPPSAGGASSLQALRVLAALRWSAITDPGQRHHALTEALRLVWRDRFVWFGDPQQVSVPLERLLGDDHAEQLAEQVRGALRRGRPLALEVDSYEQDGTVHISAGDAAGNLVALTLTHGGGFGARVTVPETGLMVGHGMSRFDPRPGFANSVAPGKRPLNNMCPTVVLRNGRPLLAIGGRGGRRIPNALCAALLGYLDGQDLAAAVAAPRLHTEGRLAVMLDAPWQERDAIQLQGLGFTVTRGAVARLSAVSAVADGAGVAVSGDCR